MTATSTDEPVVKAPIDPRIRARRIEVARGTARRRFRRLGIVLGVVGLLAALVGVAVSPLLDVDHVRVQGAARSGDDVVRRATAIERGATMATLDPDEVRRSVVALPWVSDATVVRHWPGTVEVSVEEWQVAGAVRARAGAGQGERWVLLSRFGDQLQQVDALPEGVVAVEGLAGAGREGRRLAAAEAPLELIAGAPASLRPDLRAVRVTRTEELEVVVALPEGGELTARLGPATQLSEKLVALATVIDQADLQGSPRVDVRVPASPVLTREGSRG